MQRLSYPTETVLSTKITRDRIVLVLSFKNSPRKPLGRRPSIGTGGMGKRLKVGENWASLRPDIHVGHSLSSARTAELFVTKPNALLRSFVRTIHDHHRF